MQPNEIAEIMQDRTLTVQAKALYIYILQISGGQTRFRIKVEEIQNELQIGSCAYYSHLHRLIDNGYVVITQMRDDRSRFCGAECCLVKRVNRDKNGGK